MTLKINVNGLCLHEHKDKGSAAPCLTYWPVSMACRMVSTFVLGPIKLLMHVPERQVLTTEETCPKKGVKRERETCLAVPLEASGIPSKDICIGLEGMTQRKGYGRGYRGKLGR